MSPALRLSLGVGLTVALMLAQPAPAADSPEVGKTALVNTVSGTVKVREKGELVQLGPVVGFKSETPPGHDCIRDP